MSKTLKRKLIEVALPLEAINRESAREKSIRHGHPSTLHLWWARRPLAAARAVLFAQLVDDPSSHEDQFPTKEAQKIERARLHGIIERLVAWENIQDEKLLAEAHEEILRSTDGNPPAILDPFAGGGTIPLEAQRLGLEAHASDLNPVAVLINKAMIEIPPKFRDQAPVFPGLAATQAVDWNGTSGLGADVRAYGEWLRDQAEIRVGHLYPKANLSDGSVGTVIAWMWARDLECPNPTCQIRTPLVNSFAVSTRPGSEAYVVPKIEAGRIVYTIAEGKGTVTPGTVTRSGARCLACNSPITLSQVRSAGKHDQIGRQLMCVVVKTKKGRTFLPPSEALELNSSPSVPQNAPAVPLPDQALGFRVQAYGIDNHRKLYTTRQLQLLCELVDLCHETRHKVIQDGGSENYADAISIYLALLLGRVANRSSSQSFWHPGRGTVEQVFARNAMPMIWVYAEANPFSNSTGNISGQLDYLVKALEGVPGRGAATVMQRDAAVLPNNGIVVSTDPPYYDNVPYADLSDFFYVWHRQVLQGILPEMYATVATPKAAELIAEPARSGGKHAAAKFFEEGLRTVFSRIVDGKSDFPFTVFYAFKQSETEASGTASTGWETMLQGLVDAGAMVTATWPVRTELAGGLRELGRNALASSIVLSLRTRPEDASTTDRRGFISALQAELPHALRDLQQGAIAPVDLPQAAVGPGMAVFSRYASVIESDGSSMKVRSALARINEVLDQVLNEQEGDFDPTTRFAIAWYRQHGYATGKFGLADDLARARNTSVETMVKDEILKSAAGKVTLLTPLELRADYDILADAHTSVWEAMHQLIRILETEGVVAAGAFLAAALSRPDDVVDADLVKELAFLLFSVAEKNGWTKDALSFNTLATSWPEIIDSSRASPVQANQQSAFDFTEMS